MNRERLWVILAVLLPAFAATVAPLPTGDLAFQVRAGELMIRGGEILRVDPFTFTALGDPWIYQQWGAGLSLAWAHNLGGWGGLALVRTALIALAVALVYVGCRAHLDRRTSAYLALAGFLLAIGSLALRAQLFGITCYAATVAILAMRHDRHRLVWALPLVVVVWANVHGSFFLAVISIALAALDDMLSCRPNRRSMAAILGLSGLATVVTPFGGEVWIYAVGLSTSSTINELISEWQRTSPLSLLGVLYYGSVLAAVTVVIRAHRAGHAIQVGRVLWLLVLAGLGAYAERGVVWWALGAPVALAPFVAVVRSAWAGPVRAEPLRLRRLNASLAIGLLGATVALQPIWRGGDPLTGPPGLLRDAPAGLAQSLADLAGPLDRVVAPQPWASWFEWAAADRLVMVDSRIELFPQATWDEYIAISRGGPEAVDALARTGATVVVVDSATQEALELALRTLGSGWRLAYEDADGAVFTRAD